MRLAHLAFGVYQAAMIDTERLRLRPPQLADFEATAAMFAEPRVIAHIGGKPLDRAEAWVKFLRDVGHWTALQFGQFSIFEAATGHYIGKVGHARFERLPPSLDTAIEMSWTLRSGFHGKGYAIEAAAAAQAWFDSQGLRRTACLIAPANAPSRKLAARLGYALHNATVTRITLVRDPR